MSVSARRLSVRLLSAIATCINDQSVLRAGRIFYRSAVVVMIIFGSFFNLFRPAFHPILRMFNSNAAAVGKIIVVLVFIAVSHHAFVITIFSER